jgi:chitin synthase
MPSSNTQYDHRDDQRYLAHQPSRNTLYDPRDDQLQFLAHHPSTEWTHSAAEDPGVEQSERSAGPPQPSNEQKIDGRLYKGNLVRDCPIPPKLLKTYPPSNQTGRDEFTHMRYTAATCDPKDFISEQYELRQTLFTKTRQTELLIVITMYNEDDLLFARTLAGVFENIEYMCNGKDKYGGCFGKDGWKKIVVCVVSDGRAKLNPRTKAVMTALGVYQEDIGTEALNGKPVTGHIYEYTTRVGIAVNKKTEVVETKPGKNIPVQMIFCLKEENKGKLNSHRWAFQAIGEALKGPNIVVLLDAGTRPGKTSVYQLYRAFLLDKHCGGACGEIKAMLGTGMKLALKNPVVACQNFEYKMSNLLDKPMESAFGFISVLPGAFSAYRYVALQNNEDGIGPLEKYFGGETKHASAGIFTRNMYLAEDRILCFELVAKKKASWVLTYVKSATGETDVPEGTVQLIKQRRRWLNGSFFAAVYALAHFGQIFGSSHSMIRKIMFIVEFTFQLVNMIFAWFAIGNFFLVFQILTTSLGGKELLGRTGEILSVIIEWIYLGTLVTCFVLALGNKPEGSPRFYRATVWIFGLIMLFVLPFSDFKELDKLIISKVSYIRFGTNSLQVDKVRVGRREIYILGAFF